MGGITYALNAKSSFIYAPNQIIEKQFTPAFQNLKPLAQKWKSLVKAEDERRYRPDYSSPLASSSDSLTHQMIINLLRSYANNLPPIDP